MFKSDVFALAGVCLLAVFAFQVWPPLCLLVFGLACLRAAYATAVGEAPEAGDTE